jgi:hypothetical protein
MAELDPPNSNAAEADSKAAAAAARSKDEVALELMKFIAVNTGYGKGGQSGAGFSAKQLTRTPEEHADALLELFGRCRRAVAKEA